MRVIAGQARGRKLKAPTGLGTRPITDRIKEALFNVLQNRIADCGFLDLYAGSGSVGIEALSRGAASAVFIDLDQQAVKIIRENLHNCGLQGGEVYRNDIFNGLNILHRQNRKFDLIYADPPFTQEELFEKTLHHLSQTDLLYPDGIIIIRVPRKKVMPASIGVLHLQRSNDYGESSLYYYSLTNEEVQ